MGGLLIKLHTNVVLNAPLRALEFLKKKELGGDREPYGIGLSLNRRLVSLHRAIA